MKHYKITSPDGLTWIVPANSTQQALDHMDSYSPHNRRMISGVYSAEEIPPELPLPRENNTDASQQIEDMITDSMAPENNACPEENFQHEDWQASKDKYNIRTHGGFIVVDLELGSDE